MNKTQFVSEIVVESGCDAKIVNAVLSAITEVASVALTAGDTVQFIGLGTLERKDKPAREGYNNLTKKPFHTPASTTVTLKPSKRLIDRLNGVESDEDDED